MFITNILRIYAILSCKQQLISLNRRQSVLALGVFPRDFCVFTQFSREQ